MNHYIWQAWLNDEEFTRADAGILDKMRDELEVVLERLKDDLLKEKGE